MKIDGITPKQQLFVREYAVDFNATQAALRAGFPKKAAGSTAYELLKKPQIQACILDVVGKALQKCDLSVQFVIDRLMAIADSDITELLHWPDGEQPTIKHKSQMTPAQRRSIRKIKQTTRVIRQKDGSEETIHSVDFEVRDPIPALRLLGQYLQIWSGGIPEAPATDPNSAYLLPPDQAREVLAKLNGRDPMKLIGAVVPVQEAQEVTLNGNGVKNGAH